MKEKKRKKKEEEEEEEKNFKKAEKLFPEKISRKGKRIKQLYSLSDNRKIVTGNG